MVSFTSAALLSLAAVASLASPLDKRHRNGGSCLSEAEATQIVDNYGQLLSEYSDSLANAFLTPGFTDYSESVNTLINTCPHGSAAQPLPLLSATFSSRASFEKGQGQQPSINFNPIGPMQYSCQSVTVRWETTNTGTRPVVGILLLEVQRSSSSENPWLIDTVYSEFDSGAWLQNLEEAGQCTATASGSPTVPIPSSVAPAASTTPAYSSPPAVSATPA